MEQFSINFSMCLYMYLLRMYSSTDCSLLVAISFRRQVYWISKQILQLVMEDAIDDWLLNQIQLLRRDDVVAAGIRWVSDVRINLESTIITVSTCKILICGILIAFVLRFDWWCCIALVRGKNHLMLLYLINHY